MKNTVSKFTIPVLVLSASSFIANGQAHAGEWVFDHYEVNGDSISKQVSVFYSNTAGWQSKIKTTKVVWNWANQKQRVRIWFDGVLHSTEIIDKPNYFEYYANAEWGKNGSAGSGRLINGFAPQTGHYNYTFRPVFRWDRSKIQNTDIPDPNDNAPDYCWIYEEGILQGTQHATGEEDVPFDETPYTDTEASFGDVEFPFAKYNPNLLIPYGDDADDEIVGGQFKYAYLEMRGSQVTGFKALKNQDIAIGPSRTFKNVISLHSYLIGKHKLGGAGSEWGYNAYPVSLRVLSRMKGGHDPNDLVTDFNSHSTVAAGGFIDDLHAHEADVVLQVLKQDGTSVGNVKMKWLPSLDKKKADGAVISAKLLPSDGTYTGTLIDGRAPITKLLSRDELSNVVNLGVHIFPKNAAGIETIVKHDWANVEWKMGENGEKPWDINYYVGDADFTQWIWAKTKIFEDKPLLGHTMLFAPKRLVVRELQQGKDTIQTVTYTTIKSEADQFEGGPDQQMIYAADISGYTSKYLTLPTSLIAEPNGVYKGQVTLIAKPEFEVQDYQLSLEDQGVYKRTN